MESCENWPKEMGLDGKGMIIYFGGTTSSGKTTVISSLRKQFCPNAEYVAEDQEYPLGPTGPSSRHMSKDDLAHRINHYAKELAEGGKVVLVDEVDIFHCYMNDASRVFEGSKVPVVLVLLYCPIRDYPMRVGKRNTSGDPSERRSVWRSLIQWAIMYEGTEFEEPETLEFVSRAAFDRTLDIAMNIGLGSEEDRRSQRNMTRRFITKLIPFDDFEGLYIRPRDDYDFVFSSSGVPNPGEAFKKKLDRWLGTGAKSVLSTPRWDKTVDEANIACGYCSISGVRTPEQILMSQLLCADCMDGMARMMKKRHEDRAKAKAQQNTTTNSTPAAQATGLTGTNQALVSTTKQLGAVAAVTDWLFGCIDCGGRRLF